MEAVFEMNNDTDYEHHLVQPGEMYDSQPLSAFQGRIYYAMCFKETELV